MLTDGQSGQKVEKNHFHLSFCVCILAFLAMHLLFGAQISFKPLNLLLPKWVYACASSADGVSNNKRSGERVGGSGWV